MTLTQSLFSFKGRINRAKFWLMRLLIITFMCAYFLGLGIFIRIVGLTDHLVLENFIRIFGLTDHLYWLLAIFGLPCSIFWFWSGLAVNTKRWHDRGKSAWWLLIELIPVIGVFWVFIELGCLKGTDGKNRFGPDPLESL